MWNLLPLLACAVLTAHSLEFRDAKLLSEYWDQKFNNSQEIAAEHVTKISDSLCQVEVVMLCRGEIVLAVLHDVAMTITTLKGKPKHVIRKDAKKDLAFITWTNGTHHTHLLPIDLLLSEFSLENLTYSVEYHTRYGRGYFDVHASWTNPFPQPVRVCLLYPPTSTSSCMLRKGNDLIIEQFPSQQAVRDGIQVKLLVSTGMCEVPLQPIKLTAKDCPEEVEHCLPSCVKPDNVVNVTGMVTEDQLVVSWVASPDDIMPTSVYAIRWGYMPYDASALPTDFPTNGTQAYLWQKPNTNEEVQFAIFNLDPNHFEQPGFRIQIVPLCSNGIPKLQRLDNSSMNASDVYFNLLDDIFQPERVDCRIFNYQDQELVITEVPPGVADPHAFAANGDTDEPSGRLEVSLSVLAAVLVVSCVVIALVVNQVRRRKAGRAEMARHGLQMNPIYQSLYQDLTEADKWELPPQSLDWGQEIGFGAFGCVHRCILRRESATGELTLTVAVKTLTGEMDEISRQQFIQEILVMKELGVHENILQLIGCITTSNPVCLITEYAVNGDLLNYLHSIRADNSTGLELKRSLRMAVDVVTGMDYISTKGYIHRDLAARNLLLDDNFTIKISDFGLSRYLHSSDVYVVQTSKRLPVKWLSVEALANLQFSSASDVWAFGVVLFELMTLGETPYPTIDQADMLKYLNDGNRMECPTGCDRQLYDVMLSCWKEKPKDRPSFSHLQVCLQEMLAACDYPPPITRTDSQEVDEGCIADCVISPRLPLSSESSNYSDVSMIIISPQTQRKSYSRSQSDEVDQEDSEIVFSLNL